MATAKLIYQDGSAAGGDFNLSKTDLLKPGAEIEIQAGSSDESVTIFKGVVVRHGLKIRESRAPQLVVRHLAFRPPRAQ